MKSRNSQAGMTTIGWVLILAILGVFLIIGIKLVPVYISGYSLYSSLESMQKNPKLRGIPVRELRKKVMAIVDINYVNDLKPEDVSITRVGKGYEINVYYEVYRPIMGNLSLVVVWDKTVLIP